MSERREWIVAALVDATFVAAMIGALLWLLWP